MDDATHGSTEEPTTADMISDLLVEQSRQIHSLSTELAKSYEKELLFFRNLGSRDKHLKAQDSRFLKKIWWLESEHRQLSEQDQRLKAQESRFLKKIWWLESEHRRLTEQVEQLVNERDRAVRSLQNVKNSKLGKLQRRIWRARRVMRSWR